MPLGGDLVLQQCGMLNLKLSLTNDTIHLLFPSFQTSQSVDPAGFASQSSHARARIPVSHPTGGRLGTAGVPGQEQSHRPPSVREYHLPPPVPFQCSMLAGDFRFTGGLFGDQEAPHRVHSAVLPDVLRRRSSEAIQLERSG